MRSPSVSGCALICALAVLSVGQVCQSQGDVALEPAAAAQSLSEREQKILAALDEPTSVSFQDQPLSDVVEYLKERHGIEIVLDERQLETVNASPETTVTIDVMGVRLRSALNLMLRPLELDYCVRDGVVLVTGDDALETYHVPEVYDVADFLYVSVDNGKPKRDSEGLIDLVTTMVAPMTWTEVGGAGSIEVFDRGLVVTQSWSAQQETADFTHALHTAFNHYQHGAFTETIEVGARRDSGNHSSRRALDKTVAVSFQNQPFNDVISFLRESVDAPIILDMKSLEEVNVTPETSVTVDLSGLPLRNVLRLLLQPMELAFCVRDDVILITSGDEQELRLLTRIYPVKDLLSFEAQSVSRQPATVQSVPSTQASRGAISIAKPIVPNHVLSQLEIPPKPQDDDSQRDNKSGGSGCMEIALTPEERLVSLVENSIESTSWDAVGGQGAIRYVPQFEGIVVSHTEDVHEQIEELFARMRRMHETQPALAGAELRVDEQRKISLRAYRVHHPRSSEPLRDASALSVVIQRVVEPDAWRGANSDHFIEVVDGDLFIQTSKASHESIDALLRQLGLTIDVSVATEPVTERE